MKKFVLFLLVIILSSCGSETPSELTERFLTAMQDKDAKGVVSVFTNGYSSEEKKTEDFKRLEADWIDTFEEEFEQPDEKGEIVSFTIVKETIAEDSKSASVKFVVIYENDAEVSEFSFKRTDDDEWRMGL